VDGDSGATPPSAQRLASETTRVLPNRFGRDHTGTVLLVTESDHVNSRLGPSGAAHDAITIGGPDGHRHAEIVSLHLLDPVRDVAAGMLGDRPVGTFRRD
jgi:hypothetical protein